MHVYEVTPGVYKIFSLIAALKTYSTCYFINQQNETGYFCGMTLYITPLLRLNTNHFMTFYFYGKSICF